MNGVVVNKDNCLDYLYGGYEAYEPYLPINTTTGKNSNYFYDM